MSVELEERLWRCANCGVVANDRARTNCDCPTDCLYRTMDHEMAIKDGHFLREIDSNGRRWADLQFRRGQNLERVASVNRLALQVRHD